MQVACVNGTFFALRDTSKKLPSQIKAGHSRCATNKRPEFGFNPDGLYRNIRELPHHVADLGRTGATMLASGKKSIALAAGFGWVWPPEM